MRRNMGKFGGNLGPFQSDPGPLVITSTEISSKRIEVLTENIDTSLLFQKAKKIRGHSLKLYKKFYFSDKELLSIETGSGVCKYYVIW